MRGEGKEGTIWQISAPMVNQHETMKQRIGAAAVALKLRTRSNYMSIETNNERPGHRTIRLNRKRISRDT